MHLPTKTGEPRTRSRVLSTGLLAILPILFFASMAFGQKVDVTATVDRNAVNPGEPLTLTISINNAPDSSASQPTLPPLDDFEVINEAVGHEKRAMIEMTPQGPKFHNINAIRYSYVLVPKRQGTLMIGAVEVIVDGRTHLTKPISVRVAPGAAPPSARSRGGGGWPPAFVQPPPGFEDDEEDPFSQMLKDRSPPSASGSRTLPVNPNDAFFIQVETDKTEAFVGEQVTVSWYLYTRGTIRDLDTLKYPALKGFWKEDIEIATHLNFQQEVVNGLPYKKALLASFALFPMKEGTAIIDSYTAKCSVIPPMDDFGMGFGKAYTFTKSSQPLRVEVKALPTEGRPQDFSGAVGDFQVSARVEDNNVVSHQPFSFKIRFEGKGNAKLIDIPPFQPPEGMELYETQKDSKFFRTGTSYKDFSIMMIPRREGEFTIPPVSVSIFDPEQKRYVTKTTEPVIVRVGKGRNTGGNGQSLTLDDRNQNDDKPRGPVAPQLQTEWQSSSTSSASQKAIGYAGLLGFIVLGLLWQARNEFGWGQRKKDLMRRLKARLKKVHAQVDHGNWRGVGVEMTNTVYFVLGAISGEGGASQELEKLLLKAPPSVRRELAEPLTKQMEIFQILSFAPENVVGSLKDPQRLKQAVSDMEKLMEKAVALGMSSGQTGDEEKTGA